MSTLAEQERIAISERTKAGLRRARRERTPLGRPAADLNMRRVERMRDEDLSLRQIAA